MQNIIKKAEFEHSINKSEIIQLLENNTINTELFSTADRVRAKYKGDEVHLRGLIEFSNICSRNCFYCGLRRDNRNVERYRLSDEEILDFVRKAIEYGYRTIVMQSGEDRFFTAEKLSCIIKKIKRENDNPPAITLSIGERTFEEYKILKEAGADRFLIRIETTDEKLYKKLHPHMSLENRKQCLYNLKNLGYETGTGSLVGLPEQTFASLADDILFFKALDTDMAGIGPFIPHKNTPLAKCKGGEFELALKVMAITRLLMPDINIPATTAMETINPNGRIIALKSGANVVMPNVTEGDYRRKYEIYPGKICINDSPGKCINCISGKIKSIGRTIGQDRGFRNKKYI